MEPGVDARLTPRPLTMSAKSRGKRKAVFAPHEKDSSISPQRHIEVDFANNVWLPPCSKPGVIEDSFPPPDNPTASLPYTASASEGEVLDSFPDLSFFEKYAPLQKYSLLNFWFEGCSIPHGRTLDPSLLGGLGFTDLYDDFIALSPSPSSGSPM